MIHSKNEILPKLDESYAAFGKYLSDQENGYFSQGPEGKWTAGQHLGHLIMSTSPLRKVLSLPKFLIRFKWGKPNRAGRTYDGLVNRYLEKLQPGLTAPSPFQSKPFAESDKEKQLRIFEVEKEKLKSKVGKWNEKQLDEYLIPHPLLGKVTVREILFFTIYHTEHHLNILKEKY